MYFLTLGKIKKAATNVTAFLEFEDSYLILIYNNFKVRGRTFSVYPDKVNSLCHCLQVEGFGRVGCASMCDEATECVRNNDFLLPFEIKIGCKETGGRIRININGIVALRDFRNTCAGCYY